MVVLIWINEPRGLSWHEAPDLIFGRRENLTLFDIAWLSGIIGAYVVFAAGLGYFSWEYERWRR